MLIDRFVSALAPGGGSGTVGSPWTLTEAFAQAISGDMVNVKQDGVYSVINVLTQTNPGGAQPIIFRGYRNVPGDGYQGRTNNNGPLVSTNMPVINCTSNGRLTLATNTTFDSISLQRPSASGSQTLLTGALRTLLINSVVNDGHPGVGMSTVIGFPLVFNCDLTSSSTTGQAINLSTGHKVIGCRINAANSCVLLANAQFGQVIARNQFYSSPVGIRIVGVSTNTGMTALVMNNSGYGLSSSFIELPNNATVAIQVYPLLINNQVTDGSQFFNSLYSSTANVPALLINNRTRDNVIPDAGYGDWPVYGAVTTDTGGPETDYVDAINGDFRLVAGSPARASGLPYGLDIGAIQHVDGASGASTGSIFGSSIIRAGARTT